MLSLRRAVVAVLLGLVCCAPAGAWPAKEKPAPAKAESKPAEKTEKKVEGKSRRLPAHYKDVVSQAQREAIYRVQAEYGAKIAELKTRLSKLQAERKAKIEALLTPEQKQKIAQLKAAAAAKRKPKPAAK